MSAAPSSVLLKPSSKGAEATLLSTRRWPGIESLAYRVRWRAHPGLVSWAFAKPTLCYLRGEVAGRGELREQVHEPCEGEYHGSGHLSFLGKGSRATLYSETLCEAQYWCFLLSSEGADALTPEQSASINQAPSRFMFRNERVRSCLELLCECADDRDSYSMALSHALLASLLNVVTQPATSAKAGLTGARLNGVLSHIVSHLDAKLTNDDLASIAEVPPGEFGWLFRESMGVSPQRWQMDARVRQAQRMMVDDPQASLATVATGAGFSDQSHFTRAFLDVIGVTPTAWLHQRN